MPQKQLIIFTITCLILGLTELRAQESVLAAGGNVSGIGGTVSYSIGQIVYTTNTEASGSVAQGIQHPFDILGINIKYEVYPNPTTDYINLKITGFIPSNLNFQLYNIKGRLLQNKYIKDNEALIEIKNLMPALYILNVRNDSNEGKTFKVVKSK